MSKSKILVSIPDELIINKIIVLREKKVMIDRDLAELYGVTTKRLNEQVKRNQKPPKWRKNDDQAKRAKASCAL